MKDSMHFASTTTPWVTWTKNVQRFSDEFRSKSYKYNTDLRATGRKIISVGVKWLLSESETRKEFEEAEEK